MIDVEIEEVDSSEVKRIKQACVDALNTVNGVDKADIVDEDLDEADDEEPEKEPDLD